MPFQCSICDEVSTRICVRCTKDACDNHLCEKCLKCSDCCECEVALDATPRIAPTVHTSPAPEPEVEADAPPSSEDAEIEAEAETLPAASPSEEPEPVTAPLPAAETHQSGVPAPDEIALPSIEGE